MQRILTLYICLPLLIRGANKKKQSLSSPVEHVTDILGFRMKKDFLTSSAFGNLSRREISETLWKRKTKLQITHQRKQNERVITKHMS